jgi:hypothetical protein
VIRPPAEQLAVLFEREGMSREIATATATEPGALPLLSYLISSTSSGPFQANHRACWKSTSERSISISHGSGFMMICWRWLHEQSVRRNRFGSRSSE